MQPTYLPWIGYFDLMEQGDVFVFLDSVQLNRRSWQQRNRVKGPSGEQMLTVPVLSKGLRDQKISETRIDPASDFARKHLAAVRANYARAPYFSAVFPGLESALTAGYEALADLNIALIVWLAERLGIRRKMLRSSALEAAGAKTDLLVSVCGAVKADRYLSARSSMEYIEPERFSERGIGLAYHAYEHPVYPQLHGEFLPYLSALDLLFNADGPRALEIMRSGRRPAELV